MNIVDRNVRFEQARQIDLNQYCKHVLGLEFERQGLHDVWYKSPFAPEQKTSSFHIQGNRWYDFTLDKGGDITDLVAKIQGCDLRDALDKILGHGQKQSFLFHGSTLPHSQSPQNRLVKSKALNTNKTFLSYLEDKRGLNLAHCQKYLEVVFYENVRTSKTYFGIGMKTLQGYEVKNIQSGNYYAVGHKHISVLENGFDTYSIFEGMFDYLALLTLNELKSNAIILHSVGNIHKAISYLKDENWNKVYAFLDNDKAGQDCFNTLNTEISNSKDCSYLYEGYKDFNEFLIST